LLERVAADRIHLPVAPATGTRPPAPKAGAFRAHPGGRAPVVEPFPVKCNTC
jgi:hypothetical protein